MSTDEVVRLIVKALEQHTLIAEGEEATIRVEEPSPLSKVIRAECGRSRFTIEVNEW